MENNLSLLRPFDLEAVKRGEKVVWTDDPQDDAGTQWQYVDSDSCANEIVIKSEGLGFIVLGGGEYDHMAMAPLCWVEGRPVYRGDVLYYVQHGAYRKFVVQDLNSFAPTAPVFLEDVPNERGVGCWMSPEKLTWNPPKVKREGWLNIYSGGRVGTAARHTREEADHEANSDRLACIHIEWEEPA